MSWERTWLAAGGSHETNQRTARTDVNPNTVPSFATGAIEGLAPGAYEVMVAAGSGEQSDPELFRVVGGSTIPTEIYRVSE